MARWNRSKLSWNRSTFEVESLHTKVGGDWRQHTFKCTQLTVLFVTLKCASAEKFVGIIRRQASWPHGNQLTANEQLCVRKGDHWNMLSIQLSTLACSYLCQKSEHSAIKHYKCPTFKNVSYYVQAYLVAANLPHYSTKTDKIRWKLFTRIQNTVRRDKEEGFLS